MKKSVFISYSSLDEEKAFTICEYLEIHDINCFIAPRDLEPGKVYGEEIIRGIDESDVFLLLASQNALQSQHVLREVERAVGKNLPILVYKTEHLDIPKSFEYFIMVCQWIDASAEDKLDSLPLIVKDIQVSESEIPSKKADVSHGETIPVNVEASKGVDTTLKNEVVAEPEKNEAEQPLIDTSQESGPGGAATLKNNWKKAVIPVLLLIIAIVLLSIGVRKLAGDSGDTLASMEEGSNYQIGDTVTIGVYNGKPIEWVVLAKESSGAYYLISKEIISIKSYDCAESGEWNCFLNGDKYTYDKAETYTDVQLEEAKGSSDWETSNIRCWLNSKEIKVTYIGQAPNMKASYDSDLAYDKEPGFLTSFTEEEIASFVKNGEDTVFLPSQEEVKNYIINGSVMFASAKPTAEALEADQSGESKALVGQFDGYYPWLTRTPSDTYASQVVSVIGEDYTGDGSDFSTLMVNGPWGVRPAILVK